MAQARDRNSSILRQENTELGLLGQQQDNEAIEVF